MLRLLAVPLRLVLFIVKFLASDDVYGEKFGVPDTMGLVRLRPA
jgi:hypothetical protein